MAVERGWVEVGDRVFVRRYAFYDQNIGVILGRAAALVIDTRSSPAQGREILADLRALTRDPVTVVVDTHGHHDHAWGNQVFRPATIWGHSGCGPFMERVSPTTRRRAATWKPELAPDLDELELDPPDRTFDEQATVEVGGRPVDLRFLGRGHTDHDIVIDVPGADVLFAGDLLEGGAVPYFGDGFPIDWPATVERLEAQVTGTVVPGHGDLAGRGFAAEQRASFEALAALARRVDAGELSLADAVQDPSAFPGHPRRQLVAPLRRAVAQLRACRRSDARRPVA